MGDLQRATSDALDSKVTANENDRFYIECVLDEKNKLSLVEGANASLITARGNQVQPCADQDDAAEYKWEPAMNFAFDCDISAQGNCNTPLENYKKQVESMVDDLQSDL